MLAIALVEEAASAVALKFLEAEANVLAITLAEDAGPVLTIVRTRRLLLCSP